MDTHQELYAYIYPDNTRQGFCIVLVPEDSQSTYMGSTTFYPSAVFAHGEYYAMFIVGSHLLGALHHIISLHSFHPRGVLRDVHQQFSTLRESCTISPHSFCVWRVLHCIHWPLSSTGSTTLCLLLVFIYWELYIISIGGSVYGEYYVMSIGSFHPLGVLRYLS